MVARLPVDVWQVILSHSGPLQLLAFSPRQMRCAAATRVQWAIKQSFLLNLRHGQQVRLLHAREWKVGKVIVLDPHSLVRAVALHTDGSGAKRQYVFLWPIHPRKISRWPGYLKPVWKDWDGEKNAVWE